ncbi:MAG: BrnT family toxin [Spirochaetes bacterium]|jgi:uncharacterized DUF497 family protein|nr:BrnT family toxin [Spirochaetota bacterium]
MNSEFDISHIIGFDWDKGNIQKSWERHQVSIGESEEVFFNEPFYIFDDEKHSNSESRYYVLGETNKSRYLFIVFTIRKSRIRIISSRDMNRKEKTVYENLKKNTEIHE